MSTNELKWMRNCFISGVISSFQSRSYSYLPMLCERSVHVEQSQHFMRHENVSNKQRRASYQYTRRRKCLVYQEKLKFIVAGFGC